MLYYSTTRRYNKTQHSFEELRNNNYLWEIRKWHWKAGWPCGQIFVTTKFNNSKKKIMIVYFSCRDNDKMILRSTRIQFSGAMSAPTSHMFTCYSRFYARETYYFLFLWHNMAVEEWTISKESILNQLKHTLSVRCCRQTHSRRDICHKNLICFYQFECIQIVIVLFPRGNNSLLFTKVATFNIGLRFNF